MKKIYFAGKFNLIKDDNLRLSQKLVNDFRSKLLGDSELLTYAQENLKLNNNYIYLGPFTVNRHQMVIIPQQTVILF